MPEASKDYKNTLLCSFTPAPSRKQRVPILAWHISHSGVKNSYLVEPWSQFWKELTWAQS